jgi:hypothetical protein
MPEEYQPISVINAGLEKIVVVETSESQVSVHINAFKSPVPSVQEFYSNIGNGTDNQFNIAHTLNSTNIVGALYENLTGDEVDFQLTIIDSSNVSVSLQGVPTVDQYKLVLVK